MGPHYLLDACSGFQRRLGSFPAGLETAFPVTILQGKGDIFPNYQPEYGGHYGKSDSFQSR
jgi:hypothetical protein